MVLSLLALTAMTWDPGAETCTPARARVEARRWDDRTYVIRQNPCVDPEANVIYLLAGGHQALLIDTGAVEDAASTVATVTAALDEMSARNLPLLVVHTHGHLDHRAGDAAFAKLPNTRVAPVESAALRAFLGFRDWPNDVAQIDLGGRVVDLIATPGHHQDHVAFYDHATRALFSGDFLMPGRLLVSDLAAYRASARRVATFVSTHPVSQVLGAHIELNARGEVYTWGSTWHPDERQLALTQADVMSLPAALDDFNGFYSRHPAYRVVNPIHNLIAFASAAIVVLALLVWWARRLWRRRRARPG
jgi:glyoxylase-like metal-dependent hydrolase (beta-lactamase superfamily II)